MKEHEIIFCLTREDVEECADELDIPRKVITDELIEKIKDYVADGLCCWSDVVKEALKQVIEEMKCNRQDI